MTGLAVAIDRAVADLVPDHTVALIDRVALLVRADTVRPLGGAIAVVVAGHTIIAVSDSVNLMALHRQSW